jgi:hypothetical protein
MWPMLTAKRANARSRRREAKASSIIPIATSSTHGTFEVRSGPRCQCAIIGSDGPGGFDRHDRDRRVRRQEVLI